MHGAAGTRWVLGAVAALVLGAGVTGWVAVGDEHDTAMATAQRAEVGVAQSLALSESAALLAHQLRDAVDALVIGTASAGESMSHTIAISQNLRSLVDVVSGLDNLGDADATSLTTISGGLADAEASLLETQGGLGEANAALTTAQAHLADAITGIDAVIEALRAAQAGAADTATEIDRQLLLWRIALVLAVLSAWGIVMVLDRPISRSEPRAAQP